MTRKAFDKPGTSSLGREVLSVGKNSLIYVFGRALTQAVGFLMIPVYTRFIDPGNYGAMELIGILAGIVSMIISLGVGDSMSRYYYACSESLGRREVVSTIIIGFGVIALPVILASLALAGLVSRVVMEDPHYRFFLQIAIVTVWFGMFSEIAFTYLRMLYLARTFVLLTTLQLIVALSLNIWFVVFERLGIRGIFYSNLIVQALTGLSLTVWILRRVGLHLSLPLLRDLLRFGVPLVPSRIALMLGFVSNRFFMRWMGPADPLAALTMVGLYSLGHKFGIVIDRFVNAPFNSFWGPRRMELLLKGDTGVRRTVARICTYATFVSLYGALGICAGIESLIAIVAEATYHAAYTVVPFITLTFVFMGLERHFSTGIIYTRRTLWSTGITLFSLVVILVWNYVFVPINGLLGAATSNLAGGVVRVVLFFVVSQRLYPLPFELGRMLLLFTAAFALYGGCQFINLSSPWATFLVRTLMAGLYPVVLLPLGFYRRDELEVLLRAVRGYVLHRQADGTM